MARKKKSRRRSRKSFSLINALESLTYAEIISRGTTGGGVWSFITGAGDIEMSGGSSVTDLGLGVSSMVGAGWKGTDQISLQDMMMEPGVAVSHMASNFQSNVIPMAMQGVAVGIGFRFGKRLLRRQLSSVNRNLVKPMLGAGIRL